MARKLRIEYPGAIYHVFNRGDRREEIFIDDKDREAFLAALEEVCDKTSWQIHAYCLMPNHFHLVVETPSPNLAEGMKWFLGVYTSRFNRRHKLFGHLFSGRYQRPVVDGTATGYLKTSCDYVHLNPVRAELICPEQPLQTYRWSSYPLYISHAHRPAFPGHPSPLRPNAYPMPIQRQNQNFFSGKIAAPRSSRLFDPQYINRGSARRRPPRTQRRTT